MNGFCVRRCHRTIAHLAFSETDVPTISDHDSVAIQIGRVRLKALFGFFTLHNEYVSVFCAHCHLVFAFCSELSLLWLLSRFPPTISVWVVVAAMEMVTPNEKRSTNVHMLICKIIPLKNYGAVSSAPARSHFGSHSRIVQRIISNIPHH